MSLRETADKFVVANNAMDVMIGAIDHFPHQVKNDLAPKILSKEDEELEAAADKLLKICLDRLTAKAKIVAACFNQHKGGHR